MDSATLAKVIEQVKASVSRKLTSVYGEDVEFRQVCEKLENDLIGIVSFIGDANFILLLMLTDAQLRKVSSVFVGVEMDSSSEDIGDLTGELANIVFGDVATDLKKIGLEVERSLPTILTGSNIEPVVRRETPSVILGFGEDNILVELIGSSDHNMHRKPGT